MESLLDFWEVKSLDVAKDKRSSHRGQITKAKLKLVELKAKGLENVPLTTVDNLITKLKKDMSLHEAI